MPNATSPRLLAATLLAASCCAYAQTLEEKEVWDNQMSYTQRSLDEIANQCKAKINFSYEKASWWKVKSEWTSFSPNGRCDDVLNTLERMCRNSEAAQQAIAKNVKAVRCAYGGKKNGFKLNFSGGTIDYAVEVDRPNVQEEIEKYLKTKM